jgi:hypothetical protein
VRVCCAEVWGLDWDVEGEVKLSSRLKRGAMSLVHWMNEAPSLEQAMLQELSSVHRAVEGETVYFQNPSIDNVDKSKIM